MSTNRNIKHSGHMSLQDAGRKGGQAKRGANTIEKKEPGFHSKIGQKGGESRGKHRKE